MSLLRHAVPVLLLIGLRKATGMIGDSGLTWFITLFACRYVRLIINIVSFWRYIPVTRPVVRTIRPEDVTVIVPTISVLDNRDLKECLTKCLNNRPAEMIVVTNTPEEAEEVRAVLSTIHPDLLRVKHRVEYSGITSKRWQLRHAILQVQTRLILLMDDHVFLRPQFLDGVVAVFEDERIGLCGTRKEVRRQKPQANSLWGQLWESFWNVMGAVYLARHNFEIRATNALDGGVFVISGRAAMIRTEIVKNSGFLDGFTNEKFLFGLFGPLGPDDDNFITREVLKRGYEIKIQDTYDATIETTLGEYPKFLSQCQRWARTTYRSNLCSLITDRTVWRRWPWTVWTTFIPSLFNFALFWDLGMIHALTKTDLYIYSSSSQQIWFCAYLMSWIALTKLVKLFSYFRRHPKDVFFFPAYVLFAYYHSFLKLWAALTFWDGAWSGRPICQGKD